MTNKLHHCVIIRDNKATEFPFVSQHLLQGELIGCAWLSIQIVEGGHVSEAA